MKRDPIPGTHESGFEEPRIVQVAVPTRVKHLNELSLGLACFLMGECSILRARERPETSETPLWHLSISHPRRHPVWDEIKTARYRLLPLDLCFGMLLPPPEEYVNIPQQDHVFHLWEITDPRQQWSAG